MTLRVTMIGNVGYSLVVDLLSVCILLFTTLCFERGDPPRRAWGLLCVMQSVNVIGLALRDQPGLAAYADYWMLPYGFVNLCLASGLIVFWVNGRASGLAPQWTVGWRVVAGGAIGGAALVAVSLLWSVFARWGEADFAFTPLPFGEAVMAGTSAIADAIVFSCALLLARIFLPMAGGQIARPYLLLTVSGLLYLVLDVFTVVYGADGMPEGVINSARYVFSAAEAGMLSAAVAHAAMVLRGRRRSRYAM